MRIGLLAIDLLADRQLALQHEELLVHRQRAGALEPPAWRISNRRLVAPLADPRDSVFELDAGADAARGRRRPRRGSAIARIRSTVGHHGFSSRSARLGAQRYLLVFRVRQHPEQACGSTRPLPWQLARARPLSRRSASIVASADDPRAPTAPPRARAAGSARRVAARPVRRPARRRGAIEPAEFRKFVHDGFSASSTAQGKCHSARFGHASEGSTAPSRSSNAVQRTFLKAGARGHRHRVRRHHRRHKRLVVARPVLASSRGRAAASPVNWKSRIRNSPPGASSRAASLEVSAEHIERQLVHQHGGRHQVGLAGFEAGSRAVRLPKANRQPLRVAALAASSRQGAARSTPITSRPGFARFNGQVDLPNPQPRSTMRR